MKQIITVKLTVDFPDSIPQIDVDEALPNAVKNLGTMLPVLPAIKGTSKRGTKVDFKIKHVEMG